MLLNPSSQQKKEMMLSTSPTSIQILQLREVSLQHRQKLMLWTQEKSGKSAHFQTPLLLMANVQNVQKTLQFITSKRKNALPAKMDCHIQSVKKNVRRFVAMTENILMKKKENVFVLSQNHMNQLKELVFHVFSLDTSTRKPNNVSHVLLLNSMTWKKKNVQPALKINLSQLESAALHVLKGSSTIKIKKFVFVPQINLTETETNVLSVRTQSTGT